MRKEIIVLALLLTLTLCILCGCEETGVGSKSYQAHSQLCEIDGTKDLYYYKKTKIVYIVFNECAGYDGYGYMSPYYSKNGKLCRYVDGEIVEID